MSKAKRSVAILVLFIMVLSLFSGCGGPQVQSSGGSALRVGWCSEPDTLNPLTSYSTESKQITNLIYEPLIGYGTDPAGNEFTVVCDANAFEVHWNLARENHRAIVLNHPILLTAQREGLLLAQRTPLPWESGHICWQTLI